MLSVIAGGKFSESFGSRIYFLRLDIFSLIILTLNLKLVVKILTFHKSQVFVVFFVEENFLVFSHEF